jgi:soluble lytic murein transglycosylase-like protein
MDNLEKTAQESRHEIVMGGPGATRGVKPLRDEVAKNVHGFDDIIEREAQKHGVDANLIRGVIAQESEGKPGAESPKRAMGLMQLTQGTARMYGLKTERDIKDPEKNIMAGTAHLKYLLDKYHGNEEIALAAYNAGLGNVDKGKAMSFKETRHYVPQVLSNKKQFASVDLGKQAKDIKAINPDLASMGKVDYDELKKMTGVKD